MTLRLLDLLSQFGEANNRQSDGAYFCTHVPWVAPLAYLNVIFKPAPEKILIEAIRRLCIPPAFSEFLAIQNGAILFSGALSIYGAVQPGQLLNRSEPFSLPPFSLDRYNDMNLSPASSFLTIGQYTFDGTRVCMHRHFLDIHLFRKGEAESMGTGSFVWKSLDQWLTNEVLRLSVLFDHEGHRLVNESETLPQARLRKPS